MFVLYARMTSIGSKEFLEGVFTQEEMAANATEVQVGPFLTVRIGE